MSAPALLLIEDNEDDIFAFKYALKKVGFTGPLRVATDGQQAVDFLRGAEAPGSVVPSLVFLDLKLPYIDGMEVLAWIRSEPRFKSLPVVVLSGSNENRDRQRATALGIMDYLVKPVSLEDLRRLVAPQSANPANVASPP